MSRPLRDSLAPRLAAAVLCLAVAWIHVQDQGGFPGNKTPTYVGIGYYALEATGVLCALALFAGRSLPSRVLFWLAIAGVALGPLLGYILSRGPGLPDYSDDRGNWTEPLGLVSIAVEVVLLTLALTQALASRPAVGGTRERAGTSPRQRSAASN
ncbi:hypothetical protein [Streptacidiphilus sp. EB129]|uniref:hypothetical protein n=1 Tax=Streptacidiphilus sp. EB129 TaxID=3156262 RepID=UPI003515F91E